MGFDSSSSLSVISAVIETTFTSYKELVGKFDHFLVKALLKIPMRPSPDSKWSTRTSKAHVV